ncbi:site-specific DNA-methyltransferase, partial [Candidatus Aerophobetes bacterium]|nr:site-specific DNA-methyltransferase [Candidatus Aerophobetes bacterium]
YKEKVRTIYIDPPFNKEQDADYLYNVKYKDSTWISLLGNRLRLARSLLSDRGSIFVRCDYNGNMFVRLLMNEIFGKENFKNEIILNRSGIQKEAKNKFLVATDSLFLFSKNEAWQPKESYEFRETGWLPFVHYPGERKTNNERIVFEYSLLPPAGRHWGIDQELINNWLTKKWIRFRCKVCGYEHYEGVWKKCPKCNKNEFIPEIKNPPKKVDSNWTGIPSYSQDPDFPTRNAEELLQRVIESTSNPSELVMDFFLGIGTATAVAQKLKRKWIGIEIGEHFFPYKGKDGKPKGVLVRMKEVLASKGNLEPYGISNSVDWTGGGSFKYQILEQYEDTLDNIELKENQRAQELFKDEYLLKYFLDYETRESPYLLNIDMLKSPFAYKLKVNLEEVGEPQEVVVDIPETFNYLLGLKVKKIKTRSNRRKYLFILGEKEGKDIAIVWREYDDNWNEKDFKEDKKFIIKKLLPWTPHIVYVNGQSVLTPKLGKHTAEIRYIEPEFKRLMG